MCWKKEIGKRTCNKIASFDSSSNLCIVLQTWRMPPVFIGEHPFLSFFGSTLEFY